MLEKIGHGGMGQIYAYDTGTDRVVALKVLPTYLAEDEQLEQRFRREARIAASLNDPHVVPIHGCGEIDGRLSTPTSGPNTNESQFFLAYRDAEMEPTLDVLDKIAKVGVAGNREQGMPARSATITSVRLG
ncbi:hypothetical protein AWC19_01575 [Mycobacterium palustre]|uniref:Protein kinase domain-containing protein n=1 Tax=Mycobacterium palustre TaxID=153971 RepID=A0A1X1ZXH5_9MYCO|nr:hypothetical protein AWC19_01575 [Mycobacterium palustre]